jgi:hypothetical protein
MAWRRYFSLAYMFFFGLSDGIVIWVFISEIFPNSVRSKGQSLGSFTHWFLRSLSRGHFWWRLTVLPFGLAMSLCFLQ